ncbi:DNA-binding transcriptional regulator CynR [Caballeronia arationis]|uniref:Transcriptional regulator, LysR family n=1 Tax=Caballeronia arationis TaxID=1777142 RepID=A0A7Z7IG12_9BURK|nr:transcriptional regulator CynR [Caballeronia arationis]SAK95300.1 DNA-binding transcriptional regulator CynR [Caballeronia arationis]SOE89282.1 transcriptional regulator, LysR family [Caballeronia arationis]
MLLRHIRYLIAVAEQGNFTRAAETLRVSQPALSQQIRQLESELGGQLFDRSGRVVRLTDFGLAYIEFARRAVLDLEAGRRALHDVRDLSRGHVRVAVTPTFTEYLVGPLVGQFHAMHPAITIELSEMSLEAIEAALGDDQVDVAIGFTDIRSDDIEIEPLFIERLTLVAGGAHPLTRGAAAVAPPQLAGVPLALLTGNFVSRRYIDDYFHAHGIKPNIALQANSISAVLKIVRRGDVAAILPSAMQREHGDLSYVPLDPPFPTRTVALLKRRRAYRTAASVRFCALLKEMLHEGELSALQDFAERGPIDPD